MFDTIQEAVKQLLPAKRKAGSGKWLSFNAPCCVHNGESADTRSRGGFLFDPDGAISYSCFNCNYHTAYVPGRHLTYKFRKLLSWMGADDNTVHRLVIEAIRIAPEVTVSTVKKQVAEDFTIKPRELPPNSASVQEWATMMRLSDADRPVPEQLAEVVTYVASRKIDMRRYDFYLTDDTSYNLHKRVIVPCYWQDQLIGYTARAFREDVKPKYHSHYESNYVFNVNNQKPDSKFVIVSEGPFDAMAVDGVAVLSNECSEVQADIIDSLKREVIVVPDFDVKEVRGRRVWAGAKLIDQAMEYGWTVSFPVWAEECKDVSKAVEKYGKLFVLKSILEARVSSKLKIELMRKRYYK
jgi:hypothetical protein